MTPKAIRSYSPEKSTDFQNAMLTRRHILCTTGIVAAAVRLVFYALFSGTMFRHYHMVTGLDMQTLLRFSEWGKSDQLVPPFFTLHRVVIYLIWKFNHAVHSVDMLFLLQALSGIAGALAVADLTLKLSGKRKAAIVAGIIYALYLPFLIYEFSVLQETFTLNTLLFAVWMTIYARKKRFTCFPALASGILWGFVLTGRPVSLLVAIAAFAAVFRYCKRKQMIRRWWIFLAGALLITGIASGFNHHFKSGCGPFYNVLPYTIRYNTVESASASEKLSVKESKWKKFALTATKMIQRTPLLLSVRELPENQNIYFWREKMPETRLLLGPEILMTLTVFGLLMLLFSGRWKHPEGIILWMLLLAPALCGREAIGRYRLMLCPYFIIIAVIGISSVSRIKSTVKKRIFVLIAAVTALGAAAFELNRNHGLRLSDYHSWAIATEAAYGTNDAMDAYYEYWEKSLMRNDRAFRVIQDAAMRSSNFEIAAHVIRQAELAGAVNPSLIAYFTGLLHVGKQNPDGVYRAFARIKPETLPPDIQVQYNRILFETLKFLRQRENKRLNKSL